MGEQKNESLETHTETQESASEEKEQQLHSPIKETDPSKRSHKRHKSFDSSISSLIDAPTSAVLQDTTNDTEDVPLKEQEESSLKKEGNTSETKNVNKLLNDLLGITTDEWPYSETLLNTTLSLKAEMERTKRASLKLSALESSMELLKYAVESGIPSQYLHNVFLGGSIDQVKDQTKSDNKEDPKQAKQQTKQHQTSTSVFKVNIPQQTQFQFHHWQGPEDERPTSTSTGANSGSQSADNPQSPVSNQIKAEDRKRKNSEISENPPKQQEVQSFKPSTPNRFTSSTHRRNQSEASVSQLRSIYENKIHQQQSQQAQRSRPFIPQQHSQQILRSPYHTPSEPHNQQQQQVPRPQQQQPPPPPNQRPLYYPYSQPHGSSQVQYIQGPPPTFQFPRPPPPSQQVQIPHQIITQSPHLQQPISSQPSPRQIQATNMALHPASQQQFQQSPYPGNQSRHNSEGSNASPVSKSKGKSDVSFLISTPNNPPK